MIATIFLVNACGPVKSRVHTSPAFDAVQQSLQQSVRDESARRTKANTFYFQPETHECRNSLGVKGLNNGVYGPCALISDLALIPEESPENAADLRGSVFFYLNLKQNTSFKNANLEDTTWINVSGSNINFDQAKLSGARFHDCKITDQRDKPVQ